MTTFTTEDRERASNELPTEEEIQQMWQERKYTEPLDANEVSKKVQESWAKLARAKFNAGSLSKDNSIIPCFVITEYGIDIVRDVYIDSNFGVMIDGRLK